MLSNVLLPLSIVVTVGYLVGCVPVANTVARRHGGGDLRLTGDRNPGYWNARTVIGIRAARPILIGDTSKGALGALVGLGLAASTGGPWWWAPLGGGAAMLGHAAPVSAGFRGGRSVLAFVGTAIVTAPVAAGSALVLTGLVRVTSGRTEHAARAGVAAFPIVQLLVDGPQRTLATGILMTFIGVRFATARISAARRTRA